MLATAVDEAWTDEGAVERKEKRRALDALGERIARLASRIDVAQQRLLAMIREFDEKEGWGQQGALSCAHWLSWRLGLDLVTAREKVRVARALGRLPLVEEAYRRGKISYSKVRAITRIATPHNEERLLEVGLHSTGAAMEKIVRSYRKIVEPRIDGGIPGSDAERYVRSYTLSHGFVRIEAQLHADEAAIVLKALDGLRFTATKEANRARRKAARRAGESSGPAGASEAPVGPAREAERASSGSEDVLRQANAASSREAPDVATAKRGEEEESDRDESSAQDQFGASEPGRTRESHDPAEASAELTLPPGMEKEIPPPNEHSLRNQIGESGPGHTRGAYASAEASREGEQPGKWADGTETEAFTPSPPAAASTTDVSPKPASRPGAWTPPTSEGRPASLKAFDRADALVALAQSVLDAGAIRGQPAASRFEVVMTVDAASLRGASETLATLDGGAGVPTALARMVACDAALVPMAVDEKGDVLDVGRRRRTIPPSIRRALRRRDGGCRFPGCLHDRFVDGHHIVHWADGGETKVGNLILLCRHHHRLVHEEGFSVVVEEGGPVFRGPDGDELKEVPYRPELGRSVLDTRGFLRGLSELEGDGEGDRDGEGGGEAQGEGEGVAVPVFGGGEGTSAPVADPDDSESRADEQGEIGYPLPDTHFAWDLSMAIEGLIRADERGARERRQS